MKKVDIVVTKQNDVDVIRYELGAADVYDDKAADKATGLPNVIPFQYSDEDGKRTITSYVKEKMTLEAMYKRTMNKKQVLSVLSGLVSIFEIGTQGIPVSYIIKEPSYIYVNEENLAVKCVLVAVKQDVMPLAEIPAFFRNVVSRIMYDDSDRDNYVAQLLTAINSNDFTVSRLKSIVDEQLEAMGLFISKENGLTDMPDRQSQEAQAPAQVKVNKLGVMNNIQNANRQAQIQSMPPMGQPMPQQPLQAGQPPMMGQPMPQPKPAGQPPMMGQPMPQPKPAGQPPMMGQPMQQPQLAGQPPMGQPMPQQPPKPMEATHGNLVGQMGSKPIPHIVRKKTGEVINITKPEFSIGKSKTKADYAIEDNTAISRVHCIIVQKDGVNYIKDNNSTNHTYLNGVELAPGKEQLLKNKTLIQMGDEEFTFFLRKSE